VTAHTHATAAIANTVAAGIDGLEHVTFWTEDGVDDAAADLIAEIVHRHIVIGATAGFAPVDAELEPAAAQRMPLIIANMVRLLEAGALIVAGTDAGVHPSKPHDVLRHAIPQLVLVGMSPVQALLSATSVSAGVCGLADRKGRLAAGFDADILAVKGDPLTDTAALQDIRAVWVRGVLVR
jgi:imidazolonepropionase-like amidohydrolase